MAGAAFGRSSRGRVPSGRLRVIEEIGVDEYVARVLPHSSELWANGRTHDAYVDDWLAVLRSSYGRRHVETVGIRENGEVVASLKRYDREIRCEGRRLRASGIGAVFTRPDQRNRGLATAMIAAFLDRERERGVDLAYLYSDIHPAFYATLGFVELPSRSFRLRAKSLGEERVEAETIRETDWPAIGRCFETLDASRRIALRRTPAVWDWVRLRFRKAEPHVVNLLVRDQRGICAYVLGRREITKDAFVVDEFAFRDERGGALIAPLLRYAAGDLDGVTGWLPPAPARAVLPRGSVRRRTTAILMAVPLSDYARSNWPRAYAALTSESGDGTWSTDHV